MEKMTFQDKRWDPIKENVLYFLKWTLVSAAIGPSVGAAGAMFGHAVLLATRLWQTCHWTVFLMPVSGLAIVGLYHLAHEERNKGTDMVIESILEGSEISLVTAPLIVASTILSHMVSASTGREGAALQLGGSLGRLFGKVLRFGEQDRKICVMCGMSACFAALFGTPLAAGIFAIEMVRVGIFYYAALVPCVFSSFIGAAVAGCLGLEGERYDMGVFPGFGFGGAGTAVFIAVLCAMAGILLCACLHRGSALYQKYFPNPYIRVLAASAIYIVLTLLFPERLYNGGGLHLIEKCFEGEAVPCYAFLAKILFTAVVLGAGFKGGEIVPALCVGATLGHAAAAVLGMPLGLGAALGMMCVFVSVTNCPMATMFLAFEMFGFGAMPFFAIAVAVSFTLSGYCGLYHSQRFPYSKHICP